MCGSMLIVNDAQQRVEEHLTGKMHTGFQKIRTMIQHLKVRISDIICILYPFFCLLLEYMGGSLSEKAEIPLSIYLNLAETDNRYPIS